MVKLTKEERIGYAENEFEDIHKQIRNKKELSHYDFLRIRNFKLRNFSASSEEKIKKLTKKAFELADKNRIVEAIKELMKLHGIAIPMASTILAIKFPDKYAIIDRLLIEEIGDKEWLKPNYAPRYTTDPEIYEQYILTIRNKAKEQDKKLRDFEREIWERRTR